jgi:D-amino-acid dehydrogenase
LLGIVPELEGLMVGDGLGAAGLTIGPFAGRMLANLALGDEPPIDISPFDPSRRPEEDSRIPPLR